MTATALAVQNPAYTLGQFFTFYGVSMSLVIGNTTLKNGIMLAPMAGVTDYAFRTLCRRCGAEYTVSEMVSAKAMHFRDEKTAQLARIRREEAPMAIQIFGSEPEIMAEAACSLEKGSYRGYISEIPPAAIDINMGCPVRKIVTNGEGSALMNRPELVFDIVKAVVSAVTIPVTVKIRAGWSQNSKNAVEVALAAEEAGASLITVHGRTREQLYRPPVDLFIIAEVKAHLHIPVVGNGGIASGADALKMKRETGCDGVMVAQGAEGNPLLFREITAAFEGCEYEKPSCHELLCLAREHMELLCEDKGEIVGVREARKHLAWYVTGMRGATAFRGAVNQAVTKQELLELLNRMENGIYGQLRDPTEGSVM